MIRHTRHTRDTLIDILRTHAGDVTAAAAACGVSRDAFAQRMHRQTVTRDDLAWIRRGHHPPPRQGDATLQDAVGVTLHLADYALLRERAAMAGEADRLAAELQCANRIIASLTRELSVRAA